MSQMKTFPRPVKSNDQERKPETERSFVYAGAVQ
jgi:hypothetical protein